MTKVEIDGEGLRDRYAHLFKHNPHLGKQSMEQIKNLPLYNLANQFVNEYLEHGSEVALLWLTTVTNAEERVEMREYVKFIFDKNGYVVN